MIFENRLRISLSLGFCILIHFLGIAQINKNKEFLEKVGVMDSLYSKSLNEYREIYIQLPDNYKAESNKKYPVVYILDGEVLLPTVNNVQSFYSGGFTPEMVLVGISNANHRTRDLTTSKITEKYGIPFNEENGDADNFIKFLETELLPFIENKYPVTNFRTLIGHSYGGLFAIYTLINHPQLFSNYLAIDPSLDWDNQKLLTESKGKLSNNDFKGKRLFMSLNGQLHMANPKVDLNNVLKDTSEFTLFARSNIAFSDAVKQNKKDDLAFKWNFYPRDLHGTISFPSIMDGLIFNFEWYQMENTDKFNSSTTSKEELYDIVNSRDKKLKYHFGYSVPPYPEELLNVLGYMSLERDQLEKAKMYFEFCIKFFPKSPNSFDSMADYYERKGDNDNALKFVIKANEISNNDYYKERIEALKNRNRD
jgi:predicted alpha/beta superfamily hydrolase